MVKDKNLNIICIFSKFIINKALVIIITKRKNLKYATIFVKYILYLHLLQINIVKKNKLLNLS